jgi:hypothetical protein
MNSGDFFFFLVCTWRHLQKSEAAGRRILRSFESKIVLEEPKARTSAFLPEFVGPAPIPLIGPDCPRLDLRWGCGREDLGSSGFPSLLTLSGHPLFPGKGFKFV